MTGDRRQKMTTGERMQENDNDREERWKTTTVRERRDGKQG